MDYDGLTYDMIKNGTFTLDGTEYKFTFDQLIKIASLEPSPKSRSGITWGRLSYGKCDDLAEAIGNHTADILAYIVSTMSKANNHFHFRRQEVARKTGVSISAIRRAMMHLFEKDIIRHVAGDEFMLNPFILYSGGNCVGKGLQRQYLDLRPGRPSDYDD